MQDQLEKKPDFLQQLNVKVLLMLDIVNWTKYMYNVYSYKYM